MKKILSYLLIGLLGVFSAVACSDTASQAANNSTSSAAVPVAANPVAANPVEGVPEAIRIPTTQSSYRRSKTKSATKSAGY